MFFISQFKGLISFLKDVYSEIGKVKSPSIQETAMVCVYVSVVVLCIGLLFYFVDLIASFAIGEIFSFAK